MVALDIRDLRSTIGIDFDLVAVAKGDLHISFDSELPVIVSDYRRKYAGTPELTRRSLLRYVPLVHQQIESTGLVSNLIQARK